MPPIAVLGRSLLYIFVFCRQLGLIVITGQDDPQTYTSKANTDTVAFDCLDGHLFTSRWLYSFPSSASCLISALSRSSAYIFFNR